MSPTISNQSRNDAITCARCLPLESPWSLTSGRKCERSHKTALCLARSPGHWRRKSQKKTWSRQVQTSLETAGSSTDDITRGPVLYANRWSAVHFVIGKYDSSWSLSCTFAFYRETQTSNRCNFVGENAAQLASASTPFHGDTLAMKDLSTNTTNKQIPASL